MSSPSGLGVARGSIEINTSQLQQLEARTRQVGQTVAKNLGTIDVAAKKTEMSIGSLAGGFGVAFGVQRLAQFATHADEVATAYKRQSVAALSLAGSQEKLNALLASYDKVTGGAIDKATLLSNVTQLQAIGFADTTAEIERFATAVRGISIATGRPQDYVQQQLQLAIANQSELRLDQIGFGIDEVKNKVRELKAANSSLSGAQAYQNALLTLAEQKYGDLTKAAVAQATGLEKARKAWANLTLEIGETFGPVTGGVMTGLTNEIQGISTMLQKVERDAKAAGRAMQGMGSGNSEFGGAMGDFLNADPISDQLIPWLNDQLGLTPPTNIIGGSRGGGRAGVRIPGPTPEFNAEQLNAQRSAKLDFEQTIQDIERQAQSARISATTQYESQRTQTIADYEKTIARDAEDFARQRARAVTQFNQQIADVQEDAAKRDADWWEDLQEKIADIQSDTAERISDIEEDYQRQRERSARDHKDRLFSAAARLDATAVFEEQRRHARQEQDAKENFDDRVRQEQENLQERIDQENQAHQERLNDARQADAERLADLQRNFEETKRLEDEDRALRLSRMATDQADQLAQMDQAHSQQMAEISRQEADELKAAQEAHLQQLAELGIYNKAWKAIQDAQQEAALKSWDTFWREFNKRLKIQGPMTQAEAGQQGPWGGFNLGDPTTYPGVGASSFGGGGSTTLNIAEGAIIVNAAASQSAGDVAVQVRRELTDLFRGMTN